MPSPSELSLDCKPQSYSMLLKSFVSNDQSSLDQTLKQLEDLFSRLEAERLKIDAFKRELPLCMQLLTNAVETSKQQLQACRVNQSGSNSKPVLEEFIPLKQSTSEGSETISNISDKANWMTSAQLWSQANDHETKPLSSNLVSSKEAEDGFNSVSSNLDKKLQRNGGAFLPFSKERNLCQNSSLRANLPDLALASGEKENIMEEKKCNISDHQTENNMNMICNGGKIGIEQGNGKGSVNLPAIEPQAANNNNNNNNNNSGNQQTHRKARRCWSPDLHRRFVNALQMLGGSQVATPKQIRELMKVDGLTNDEVKSHLQKYRLHTRRPSPSPQAAGAPAPQLVVLGGIWVPPEYATAAAAAHGGPPGLYGPHPTSHASPHYCAPSVHQDFYPPPLPHHQIHHHPSLHQQLHMYKTTSQAHSSPESDGRGNGDRSESIEDGKSESGGSWKVESGDNNGGGGGERKGNLVALRQEGEESNGSEITLKF